MVIDSVRLPFYHVLDLGLEYSLGRVARWVKALQINRQIPRRFPIQTPLRARPDLETHYEAPGDIRAKKR